MPDRHPVDDVLRRSAEVEIPADVEARMRQQFTAFRGRLALRRRPLREWAASLVERRPVRWAGAGAVLATVLAIPFFWGGTDGGRVYAAAAARLATARSVQYTIEIAPFVSVEFAHVAPAYERVTTSWGIEIRADGSGQQLVLIHGSRQYAREQTASGSLAHTADLVEELTALPRTADARLGERTAGGKPLVGYRVMGTSMSGQQGVESLDLWLDATSGTLDHVDVTPAGAGRTGFQMHIRDIRVDAAIDPLSFAMTPPAGYSEVTSAGVATGPGGRSPSDPASVQPQIKRAEPRSALVVPMRGSYLQASAAVLNVARHLQERGVVPTGSAFGRFESESHWEVGYPVPPGTTAEAPFDVVTVPGGPVASLVVKGPWGQDSAARWSRLLSWLGEHGYVAVGPPTETWSGDAAHPDAQVTEMSISVVRSRR